MDEVSPDHLLSEIQTIWAAVRQAHGDGTPDVVRRARQEVLERYRGAVYRYLLGALQDPHTADDLFQEFSLRFLRGDFREANPGRGRFRDFLKTALFHLIVDHQRRRKSVPAPLPAEECLAAQADAELLCSDAVFLEKWREELFKRAWTALAQRDARTGQAYHAVLRFRTDHHDLSSAQMAESLSTRLRKPLTADWVRQTLRRAREQYADLLLRELARSLEDPSRERLEEELIDLGLLPYCVGALERWSGH